jgi:hypothetical protein
MPERPACTSRIALLARRDVAAGSRAPEVEQEEGGKRGDDHAGGEAKAG